MSADRLKNPGKEAAASPVPIVGDPAIAPVYAIRTHEDLAYVMGLPQVALPVPLGQFLVKHGVVNAEELKEALAMQRSNTERHIGWIIKTLGHLDELNLARVLAAHRGIPCVCLAYYRAVDDFRGRLPPVATRERGIVVLHENADEAWIAVADATNARVTKAVGTVLGKNVRRVMASHREILDFYASDWRNGVGTSPGAHDSIELRRRYFEEAGMPTDSPIKPGVDAP